MKTESKTKKKGRADLILLGSFLLVGIILLGVLLATRHEVARIEISVGGEVIETFRLDQDRTYTIEGKNGNHNYLEIKDGKAYLTDAECPDGICVYMGEICHNNESIICLPNEVIIWCIDEEGTNGSSALDATAGGAQ